MEILYQDDRVVVCIKPAGVLSTDEPGGMPDLLRRALGSDAVIRGVHRLDRTVGGVMVYARTRRAAGDLGRQMETGRFQKQYLAVVRGCPAARKGVMEDWLHRDMAACKTFIVPAGSPEAQKAVLGYQVLGAKDDHALLAVELHTGRTHQIRCQLAGRGMPIAGDRKYGAPDGGEIALWSYSLSFFHPRTGERLDFAHQPPREGVWARFAQELEMI